MHVMYFLQHIYHCVWSGLDAVWICYTYILNVLVLLDSINNSCDVFTTSSKQTNKVTQWNPHNTMQLFEHVHIPRGPSFFYIFLHQTHWIWFKRHFVSLISVQARPTLGSHKSVSPPRACNFLCWLAQKTIQLFPDSFMTDWTKVRY